MGRKKILFRPALAQNRLRNEIVKLTRATIERLIRDLDHAQQVRVLIQLHDDIAATLEAMDNSGR